MLRSCFIFRLIESNKKKRTKVYRKRKNEMNLAVQSTRCYIVLYARWMNNAIIYTYSSALFVQTANEKQHNSSTKREKWTTRNERQQRKKKYNDPHNTTRDWYKHTMCKIITFKNCSHWRVHTFKCLRTFRVSLFYFLSFFRHGVFQFLFQSIAIFSMCFIFFSHSSSAGSFVFFLLLFVSFSLAFID